MKIIALTLGISTVIVVGLIFLFLFINQKGETVINQTSKDNQNTTLNQSNFNNQTVNQDNIMPEGNLVPQQSAMDKIEKAIEEKLN